MASIFVHLKTKERPRFHHRKWHPRQSNLTLRCNTNKVLQMGMSWYVGTSSKVVILNCFGHKIIILFSNKSMDGFLGGQLKKKTWIQPPKKKHTKNKTQHTPKKTVPSTKKRHVLFFLQLCEFSLLFFLQLLEALQKLLPPKKEQQRMARPMEKSTATDGRWFLEVLIFYQVFMKHTVW